MATAQRARSCEKGPPAAIRSTDWFDVSHSYMLPGEQESKKNAQDHKDQKQKYQNAPQRLAFRSPYRFPPEIALGKDAFEWSGRRERSQWSAAVQAKSRPGRVGLET